MMPTERDLLTTAYTAFNARDIDTAVTTMHPDIEWPNGWEGGFVTGHQGVRDYWTRQWAAINPRVDPLGFATDESGRTVVTVRAVVHDPHGNIMSDGTVEHVYRIEDGLIRSMEIRHS